MSMPARLRHTGMAAAVAVLLMLAGCATRQTPAPLQAVRSVAATTAPLTAFATLSVRYRNTYPRLQPYLSAEALKRERETDATRRAAYADAQQIKQVVLLYLQTLGQLAGAERYALADQVKKLGNGIKAFPDSSLNDKHVLAYTTLARVVTQAVTSAAQQNAVDAMLADSGDALNDLIDAMLTLLRLYDNNNDNERRTVLGVFDVNLPFATTPQDRLLATLATLHVRELEADYADIGRRQTQVAKQLLALASAHRALQPKQLADGQTRPPLAAITD